MQRAPAAGEEAVRIAASLIKKKTPTDLSAFFLLCEVERLSRLAERVFGDRAIGN